jgi:hypothetical protein
MTTLESAITIRIIRSLIGWPRYQAFADSGAIRALLRGLRVQGKHENRPDLVVGRLH